MLLLVSCYFLDSIHPEDGRRRRPKHVGVANNVFNHKRICWFFFEKLVLMHGVEDTKFTVSIC